MPHLNKLPGDRRGNVAITFGLVIVPVLVLAGAGVDRRRST